MGFSRYMDKKISKPVKVLVIVAVVITLVLVNLMIFAAPHYQSAPVYSSEPTRLNWFSGYSLYSTYTRSSDPDFISPTIVYYSEKDTFQLQNQEKWSKPLFVGNLFSDNISDPEMYEDLWHTPDISINGNNLSIDYSAYNGAGADCRRAVYSVTLTLFRINLTSGYDADDAGEIPVEDIEVTDLPAGEYREYRVTAELFKPKPGEIFELDLRIHSPVEFIDNNNETYTMSEICENCDQCDIENPQKEIVHFILKASDAPDIPKITCENSYMCPDYP